MPHKHKRKRGDDGDYELPPTQRAQPLPVGRPDPNAPKDGGRKKKPRRKDNDTPRAFQRIMAMSQGKKFRLGLDDGNDGTSKKKTKKKDAEVEESSGPGMPKIRPGEDLRSFSARVDAALPVSGLTRKTVVKDGKDEQGVKVWRTRKEMKMHRLYDQWRQEERKIQEKREEELEKEAEKELENDASGMTSASFKRLMGPEEGAKKKGKKGKKRRGNDDDDDPWKELKKKRAEAKVSLHDVAEAPPELHKKKSRQLKVQGGATVDVDSIPKAAGSLRRREELQQQRSDVLEAYRKIREHEQAKLTGARKT